MSCLVRVPGIGLENWTDLVKAGDRNRQAFIKSIVVQKMILF